jgi:hypothetical protein
LHAAGDTAIPLPPSLLRRQGLLVWRALQGRVC